MGKDSAKYIVFKTKDVKELLDMDDASLLMGLLTKIKIARSIVGDDPFESVVVEKDWPMYSYVCRLIEEFVDGMDQKPEQHFMNKIKEIESLLSEWKDAEKSHKTTWMVNRMSFKIEGLEAGLKIIKSGSNKVDAIDACECGEPKIFGFDYCLGCCNEDVS